MSKFQHLDNKLTVPKPAYVVLRPALFDQLDQLDPFPVAWISGKPGSGKTHLTATYLNSHKKPVIWLKPDNHNQESSAFINTLISVANSYGVDIKKIPEHGNQYLQGIKQFAQEFFTTFYQQLPDDTVIVFDNFQTTAANTEIETPDEILLRFAIETLPSALKIYVTSSSMPPASLIRHQAEGIIATLKPDTLAFTIEETSELTRQLGFTCKEALTDDFIDSLHSETEGWAAGIILLLEQLKQTPADTVSMLSREGMHHYFDQVVMPLLNKELRQLLLTCACTRRFTHDVTAAISDNKADTQAVFEQLDRHHLFISRLNDKQGHYQFDKLFYDYLHQQAQQEFDADKWHTINQRAASVLEKSGWHDEAVQCLLATEDWNKLRHLIIEQSPALQARGRIDIIAEWLNHLPDQQACRHPWITYWQAICLQGRDTETATTLFADAFKRFHEQDNLRGLSLSWHGLTSTTMMLMGNFKTVEECLDGFLSSYDTSPNKSWTTLDPHIISATLLAILFCRPEEKLLSAWANYAYNFITHTDDNNLRILVSYSLLICHLWLGDTSRVQRLMNIISEHLIINDDINPLSQVIWLSFKAIANWCLGNNEQSESCRQAGINLSVQHNIPMCMPTLTAQGAYMTLSNGDSAAAKPFIKTINETLNINLPWSLSHYYFLLAWQAMIDRHFHDATQHARAAAEKSNEAHVPFSMTLNHLIIASACTALGDHTQAYAELAISIKTESLSNSHMLRYQRLCIQCWLALKEGKHSDTLLKETFSAAKQYGLGSYMGWTPDIMTDICIAALDSNIETDFVRQLIRHHSLFPDVPPIDVSNWPWPVEIYTLGRFSIIIDGEALQSNGKSQNKCLQLLEVVIAHGGRDVSTDLIIDLLWPESSGDDAKRNFDTTLHRLRKLLKYKDALIQRNNRLSLNDRICCVDTWRCFRHIATIKAEADKPNPNQHRITHATRWLTSHRYEFMNGNNQPWVMKYRKLISTRLNHCLESIKNQESSAHLTQKPHPGYPSANDLS